MRLRNKKTGEIKEWDFGNWYQSILNPDGKSEYECGLNEFMDRTAKFREEWEDYEEQKYYYYLDCDGEIQDTDYDGGALDKDCKEMGNYFETKEEAEKAVKKLKAWKRLKDKGFKFDLWYYDGGNYQERIKAGRIVFRVKDYEENDKDLDLLFGGEK